jgi:hypothetical protein
MAGAEKICELSGEYPGWLMYQYKRNQLQITPKYRKLFRGDGNTIYVQKDGLYWEYNWGGLTSFNLVEMELFDPPFTDVAEFISYKKQVEKLRLTQRYQFAYLTDTPELQGNVAGVFINFTYDLPATKRKMKRLLRCRDLNVIFVDDLRNINLPQPE